MAVQRVLHWKFAGGWYNQVVMFAKQRKMVLAMCRVGRLIFRMFLLLAFLGVVLGVEGCRSDYEVVESGGRVYVQKKSWAQRNLAPPIAWLLDLIF